MFEIPFEPENVFSSRDFVLFDQDKKVSYRRKFGFGFFPKAEKKNHEFRERWETFQFQVPELSTFFFSPCLFPIP